MRFLIIFLATIGIMMQTSFAGFPDKTIRLIVTVGWAIYPLGYIAGSSDILNITYNLADLINKTAFGLAIWAAAVSDS